MKINQNHQNINKNSKKNYIVQTRNDTDNYRLQFANKKMLFFQFSFK